MTENYKEIDNLEIYKYSFLNSNEAMIIFTSKEFIACNNELAKFLELKSTDDFKTLNPFEIIPAYQPDGTLSHLKFKEYLEICKNLGEVRFNWLYKTVKNKDLFPPFPLTHNYNLLN